MAAKAASRKLVATGNELDIIGLVLVAASLALILLPLGLAKTASKGWSTPSMIVMIVLGELFALSSCPRPRRPPCESLR